MTKDHDFKALVRARMARTGESYAAAHRQLVADEGAGPPLLVATFPKAPEAHRWVARLEWADGRHAEMPILQRGRLEMPHDLEHYVVEANLGLVLGFWPLLAEYGPWQSVRPLGSSWGRDLVRQFQAELEAHQDELEDIESLTAPIRVLAKGDFDAPGVRRVLAENRRGSRPSLLMALPEAVVSGLVAAYRAMLARWVDLGSSELLQLRWPPEEDADPDLDGYLFRRVADEAELAAAFDTVGRQFDPDFSRRHARYADLSRRLEEDRTLMLTVRHRGRLVGGAFGFRTAGALTIRAIGLEEAHRRRGIGSRLLQTIEMEAAALGITSINLGGVNEDTRSFYAALGYRGRHSMMQKDLPLPGRVRDLRNGRQRGAAGDLDIGTLLRPDEKSGRVAALA